MTRPFQVHFSVFSYYVHTETHKPWLKRVTPYHSYCITTIFGKSLEKNQPIKIATFGLNSLRVIVIQ